MLRRLELIEREQLGPQVIGQDLGIDPVLLGQPVARQLAERGKRILEPLPRARLALHRDVRPRAVIAVVAHLGCVDRRTLQVAIEEALRERLERLIGGRVTLGRILGAMGRGARAGEPGDGERRNEEANSARAKQCHGGGP